MLSGARFAVSPLCGRPTFLPSIHRSRKIISCVRLYGFYLEASPRDAIIGVLQPIEEKEDDGR
jgi:hypothetical protein